MYVCQGWKQQCDDIAKTFASQTKDYTALKKTHADLVELVDALRDQCTLTADELVAAKQSLAEVQNDIQSAQRSSKEATDANAILRTQKAELIRENTLLKEDMQQMGHERESDDQEGDSDDQDENSTDEDSDAEGCIAKL